MPKLFYQGHGSYRLTANEGRVIFVDPYKGKGYDIPADFILITHQHSDHNKINRITQKPDCRMPMCTAYIKSLFAQSDFHGSRYLGIDLRDESILHDVKSLIEIRAKTK